MKINELSIALELTKENVEIILEKWHEYLG